MKKVVLSALMLMGVSCLPYTANATIIGDPSVTILPSDTPTTDDFIQMVVAGEFSDPRYQYNESAFNVVGSNIEMNIGFLFSDADLVIQMTVPFEEVFDVGALAAGNYSYTANVWVAEVFSLNDPLVRFDSGAGANVDYNYELVGSTSGRFTVSMFDENGNGGDEPTIRQVPVPAPTFLMGLGLVLMGYFNRKCKAS